jgi:hypothetical protein
VVDAVEPAVVVSAEAASRKRKVSEQRFLLAEAAFDVGESEVDGLHHSWELLEAADALELQKVENTVSDREVAVVAEESAEGVHTHLEVASGVQAAGIEAVERD